MLTKLFSTRCSGKCSLFFAHIIIEEKFGTNWKCRENNRVRESASLIRRKQEYCSIVLSHSGSLPAPKILTDIYRNLWVNTSAVFTWMHLYADFKVSYLKNLMENLKIFPHIFWTFSKRVNALNWRLLTGLNQSISDTTYWETQPTGRSYEHRVATTWTLDFQYDNAPKMSKKTQCGRR